MNRSLYNKFTDITFNVLIITRGINQRLRHGYIV